MLNIVVNITRNKQIQPSITVIVAKGRPRGPVTQGHPRLLRDVRKSAVMVVVVQAVLAIVRDIEIRPAVVVVISYRNSKAPPIIGHSRPGCNIGESAIVVIVEQRSMG